MVRTRSTSVKALTSAEVRAQRVDPLFLVWLVARSTEDLMDALLRQAGVTGDEFALYSVLAASPGITPSELSRWMAAPATSVSSYVKRLEARGHLVRKAHPSDRRSYGIHLTAAGRRTHRAASALFGPVRARVIEELAGSGVPVEESLLLLRDVVDGLRATVTIGPGGRAAADGPATAVDQDARQPPGE
jgi:DNA-binding MarR family transcriptional regulator